MSDPLLYDYAAPDATAFVIAHLRPITNSRTAIGAHRWTAGPDIPLPYRMVERITGPATIELDYAVMRVHTFGSDVNQAYREGRRTDGRMMLLVRNATTDVLMDDGSTANCDWCEINELAHEVGYGSTELTRVVSEYHLALQAGPV